SIKSGSIKSLSEGITLCESSKTDDQRNAAELLQLCAPHSGNSLRIGITGVPGVGKSTLIEAFGKSWIADGHKVAVLAVDPSSQKSKGSILGDKTRMESLSVDPNAFVRPTPANESLGGVAARTREAIILCETAGFDVVLVETVGVGQSEIAVKSMVDFFLLLMLSGAGDELQGIKRGIMEMADGIAITKVDGDNFKKAKRAMGELKNALHLFPVSENDWYPDVMLTSAYQETGLLELKENIRSFFTKMNDSKWIEKQRSQQNLYWFKSMLNSMAMIYLEQQKELESQLPIIEKAVKDQELDPQLALKKVQEILGLN
ncbi:MAG: methylmalonyl Co-A mutase-associated GTPase MeaB, partial [Flavobacteriales bacterium]